VCSAVKPIGTYRWRIAALLFFALTINYVDRMVFGILAPELLELFHWETADYARIVFWFEVAYAVGLTLSGRVLDRIGVRRGFAASLGGWSLATALHGLVNSLVGFSGARFLLGLTESAVFPAAVKAAAEWFPRKERALVTGIFHAGSSVGAVAAPLLVPWIFARFGWRWTFALTGAAGALWLVFWLRVYRRPDSHPRLSEAERAYIAEGRERAPTAARVPLLRLLRLRQTWAFIATKFLIDAVWRWYLYLLPIFFSQVFHLDIKEFGLPFFVIYLMADLGSVGFGGLSSCLLFRGWPLAAARKTTLLLCAVCVLPVMFAPQTPHLWLAVPLIGLATGAHQGFHATLVTVVSDLFPQNMIGAVVGVGGTAGAFGAMALLALTARVFRDGAAAANYTPLFIVAGVAYLIGAALIHLLAPKLEPVRATTPL
jgi:ACS family hexuronate transporter-like MFS transporter